MKSIHALPVTLLALAAVAPLAARAQTQAAGLWEHTFTMKAQGGEMEAALAQIQQQIAAMPPEQRKSTEAMLASRGVKVGAQIKTLQFCLSKEQAAKPAEPRVTAGCTQSDLQRGGNTVKYKFACTQPQPVSGEGQVSCAGDKACTDQSNLTTQFAGKPQQMAVDMSGKWLGADCGDVKPAGALPNT